MRSLKKRLSKLGETASSLLIEAADRIEELEDEQRALKDEFKLGAGNLVEALIGANDKVFAAEVGLSEMRLFEKLLPLVWPHCLLWLDANDQAAARLRRYINTNGCDENSHPEDVAADLRKLEQLKVLIEKVVEGLKR